MELDTNPQLDRVKFSHCDEKVGKFIEDGVLSALSRGPILGFPVDKNVHVKVNSIEYNSPETCRTLAFEATKSLLQKAAVKLFEPVVSVELEVPQSYIGAVTNDLFSSRNCVEYNELESRDDSKRIQFTAPLERMLGYSIWLRSQTSGTGSFVMHPSGFAECQKHSSSNKRTPAI